MKDQFEAAQKREELRKQHQAKQVEKYDHAIADGQGRTSTQFKDNQHNKTRRSNQIDRLAMPCKVLPIDAQMTPTGQPVNPLI